MKIVFCWAGISGYMASCWRAMIARKEYDIHVIAWENEVETEFFKNIMDGISSTLLSNSQHNDINLILNIILKEKPDVIQLSGWISPAYKKLPFIQELRNIKFIMGMDTPWYGTLRQRIAPYVLKSFLRKMSLVIVTGEKSRQYAINLGVPKRKIRTGLYGVDFKQLSKILTPKKIKNWPKSFLFIGRYEKEKGLDILLKAYKQYRQKVKNPWVLSCCGKGSMSKKLQNEDGINDFGFIQPNELNSIRLNAGVFILPSRYDPWPLALVEACASGLPILASDECGSTIELLRDHYNGFIFPSNNIDALIQVLLTVHEQYDKLSTMGINSVSMARPYSSEIWATRWTDWISEL